MNTWTRARALAVALSIIAASFALLASIAFRYSSVNADNLPIEYAGGTLAEDAIWSPGVVYVVTSALTIPNDVTLTIDSGSIVKFGFWSSGISVSSGGTLNANGTSTDGITFTSYHDDTAGGDTNGNGSGTSPTQGDYSKAVQSAGDTVSLSYATVRYADTGISVSGAIDVNVDHIFVSDVSTGFSLNVDNFSGEYINIDDVSTGVATGSGKSVFSDSSISNVASSGIAASGTAEVIYRGSFSDIDNYAITSCSWSQDCSVDAAYVEWGSGDGAHPASGSLVCGRVSRVPWVHGSATYSSGPSLFTSGCDNAPTPEQQLSSAIAGYQSRRSQHYVDCATIPDACDQAALMYSCLTSGVDIATSVYPIPGMPTLSDNSTSIGSYGSMAAQAGLNYVIGGVYTDCIGCFTNKVTIHRDNECIHSPYQWLQ